MNGLEEAHARLGEGLRDVRRAMDAGSPDWSFHAVHAFRQYCRSTGVDPALMMPIHKLSPRTSAICC